MPTQAVFSFKHQCVVAALTLIGALAACGGGSSDPAPVDLQAQYAPAVADAQVTLPSKISPHLTPSLGLTFATAASSIRAAARTGFYIESCAGRACR